MGADCGCGGECGFCASLAAKMARIHGDVILGAADRAGIKPAGPAKKEKPKGKGKKKQQ